MNLLRFAELAVYAIVAISLLALAAYMAHLNRTGEAFGAVLGTIPVLIQAIGRVGQAQAMNAMAEALGQSQPVPASPQQVEVVNKPGDPVPVEETKQ